MSFMFRPAPRPLVEPVGGFALPGECSDWLLWRRIVGRRATNDALCLKLEEARLGSDTFNVMVFWWEGGGVGGG